MFICWFVIVELCKCWIVEILNWIFNYWIVESDYWIVELSDYWIKLLSNTIIGKKQPHVETTIVTS